MKTWCQNLVQYGSRDPPLNVVQGRGVDNDVQIRIVEQMSYFRLFHCPP